MAESVEEADSAAGSPSWFEAVERVLKPRWARIAAVLTGFLLLFNVITAVGKAIEFAQDRFTEAPEEFDLADLDVLLPLSMTPLPGSTSSALGFGDAHGGRTPVIQGVTSDRSLAEPVLNSWANGLSVEDERRWMHVSDGTVPYEFGRRHVVVERGGHPRVTAFVSNNGLEPYNYGFTCEEPLGAPTTATGVRIEGVVWSSPGGSWHVVRMWILAGNTQPSWITDAVVVETPPGSELKLRVDDQRSYQEVPLRESRTQSAEIFEQDGWDVFGDGVVGSCWDNRVWVALGFEVVKRGSD